MTISSYSMVRPFFPRSQVLRERRLVTFESDDEGGEEDVLSSVQLEREAEEPRSATSEIAYSVNGRVESEQFGVDVIAALRALPKDAWTTLLDDADRDKLTAYLPHLQGWQELSNDEAQQWNVEALLSGDNFHFGNPVAELEKGLRDGRRTQQATMARAKRQKVGQVRYQLQRQSILRERILALKRLNENDYEHSLDSTFRDWKRMRLRSDGTFIHGDLSRAKETSLFVAIRTTLSGHSLGADQVAAQLRLNFPNVCAAVESDIPPYLSFEGFIVVVLSFLASGEDSSSRSDWPNRAFVKHNAESDCYEWLNTSNTEDEETRLLLWVEGLFRAPLPDQFVMRRRNNATWATKRLDRMLRQDAREKLLGSDPAFSLLEAYSTSRPSVVLKQSLLCKTTTDGGYSDATSHFRVQESKRFDSADRSFVYKDIQGVEYPVGPSFSTTTIGRYHNERVLVAGSVVNLISLVYDACARLPDGRGTRGEIKQNLMQSQFIKLDATDDCIDKAIVASLEILERVPPQGSPFPCVRFDSNESCWKFAHAGSQNPALGSVSDSQHAPGTTPTKRSMKDLLH